MSEEACSTSKELEPHCNDNNGVLLSSPDGLVLVEKDVANEKGHDKDDHVAEQKDDGDVKEMDLQDKNADIITEGSIPTSWSSSKDDTSTRSAEDDITNVPSWLDSTSSQGGGGGGTGECEPLLSDIVWKQRSGFGKYAIQHSWERRRLVLEPTRVLYYHLDHSKPHGILDMEHVTVETTMSASFEICLVTSEHKWRVCFDTRAQREMWLSALQDIITTVQDKQQHEQQATHTFQPGDHVIRWEMLPIAYPIQIHGIVLEGGKNCVIIADFGLTSYEDEEDTGSTTTIVGSVKTAAEVAIPSKESKWKKLLSFHRTSGILEPTKEQEETEKDEEDEQLVEDSAGKEQEEPDKTIVDGKNEEVVSSRILAKIKKKDSPSKKQEGLDKSDADEEQQEKDSSCHDEQQEKDSSCQTEVKKQEGPDKSDAYEEQQEKDTSCHMEAKKQEGADKSDADEEQQEKDNSCQTEAKKQEEPDKSDTDEEQQEKDNSCQMESNKQEGLDKSDADEDQQVKDSSSRTQAKKPASKTETSKDSNEQETDEKKEEDSSHFVNMMAPWGKSTKKKRLNVVVLTDPADIKKWHKVNYGRSFLDKGSGSFASWFQKSSKGDEAAKESRSSVNAAAVKGEDNNRARAESGEEKVGKVAGFASWFLQQRPPKGEDDAKLNPGQSLSAPSVKDEDGTETHAEPVEENSRKGGGFKSLLQKLEDEVVKEPGSTEDSAMKEPYSADESAVKDEEYDGSESRAESGEAMDPDTVSGASQVDLAAPDSSTTAAAAAGRTNCSRAGTEEENVPSKQQQQQKLPKSDPIPIVLARVNFLLEFGEDVLPPYHVFHSNSECIAVWCKTGRWSTLQTAVFLHSTAIGNAKSSMLLTASVAAAHVVLVPALAVGGLAMVTAPWIMLKRSKKQWEESTRKLTDLFWSQAEPAVFVAAIEHWSNLQ